MPHEITNLDVLLPEEKRELASLMLRWESARINKDWQLADKLRDEVKQWGSHYFDDGKWWPIFESNDNRRRRAFNRMLLYKVDVYPWRVADILGKKVQHGQDHA